MHRDDVTWLVCDHCVGRVDAEYFAETLEACTDPAIKALAKHIPAVTCYMDTGDPLKSYHFWITGYTHHADGSVTVRALNDGNDKVLPGIGCARIPPTNLVPCGCDKWTHPTPAQCAKSGVAMLDFMKSRGKA